MIYTLAIDPGKRQCGVALFADNALLRAALVKGPAAGEGPELWGAMALAVQKWRGYGATQTVVIEVPQAYATDAVDKTMKLQDLVAVAATIFSEFAAGGAMPVLRRPREWKGTISGDVCAERVREQLRLSGELSRVQLPAKSLQHNVLDACGLGLHFLGRLEKRRVVVRE